MLNPSSYTPKNAAEFIGPASKLASVFTRKCENIAASGEPLKLLLYGNPGVGKTELANLVSALLTRHSTEIETVNGRKLNAEMIRGWQDVLCYSPLCGGYNVKIINEVDLVSTPNQDVLLQVLDDLTPFHAVICTSNLNIGQLEQRFQSRFQQFKVEAPQTSELSAFLTRIAGLPAKLADRIAVGSGGNVRAALLDAQSAIDFNAA